MQVSFTVRHLIACAGWMAMPLLVGACGGESSRDPGGETGMPLTTYGVSTGEEQRPTTTTKEVRRVTNHGGGVHTKMTVQVVYVGAPAEGGVASRDDVVHWTLTSGDRYWGLLTQY